MQVWVRWVDPQASPLPSGIIDAIETACWMYCYEAVYPYLAHHPELDHL
jgi:hypothetical protein